MQVPPSTAAPARAHPPSRWAAAWFRLRVARQVLMRAWRDRVTAPVPRHAVQPLPGVPPHLLAEQRSPLWTQAPAGEVALVEGKVHNLRLARQSLDGIVVPAGGVMSFWRQLGRPTRRRGYVDGREVQAGCVVPTPAGGLCQLSNALARCAQAAGVDIVERHAHTARVAAETTAEADAAPAALDATVFWNYVDLRLRPAFDLRIEVEMDAHELLVRFLRADATGAPAPATPRRLRVPVVSATPMPATAAPESRPLVRGCFSCNETSCFRHRPHAATAAPEAALLVTLLVPEFGAAVAPLLAEGASRWLPWRLGGPAAGLPWALRWASVQRAITLRWSAGVRQARVMRADRLWARALAGALQPSHRHLVVSQGLLPALAEAGALGGRTVQVLADVLPLAEIQRRLDLAAVLQPAAELSDHRVAATAVDAEWRLLRRADRLLVAHRDVARVLQAAGLSPQVLDWVIPTQVPTQVPTGMPNRDGRRPARQADGSGMRTIVFPASALARKGAAQLAQALRGLQELPLWPPCCLVVLASPPSDAGLWSGMDMRYERYEGDWLQRADVVVLPAIVEHAPRALLSALAHGLPVIATPACGLAPHPRLTEVPAGDVAALRQALAVALAPSTPPLVPAEPTRARQFTE